jgi:hypothetical protein
VDHSKIQYLLELIQDLVSSEGSPEEKRALIETMLTPERREALDEFMSWELDAPKKQPA